MISAVGFILISWLAADLVAGFFHWWEDQYAVESWPIIGTLVAGPNALHHSDQNAFLQGNYWQRNWTTILPAAFVGVPVVFFWPSSWLFFVFISQANEIHAWSHQKCGRLVRAFQETGLLCSPEHHSKHHRDPFSVRFCVMSNMLNPVLDYAGFWSSIESIVSLFGPKPRSWRTQ